MKQLKASDIIEMPIQERIQLVEDIWDSIAAIPEEIKIPDWHKAELDKRLESYHNNPDAGSPWPEVKQRILSSRA